jgi:hypothetical protein
VNEEEMRNEKPKSRMMDVCDAWCIMVQHRMTQDGMMAARFSLVPVPAYSTLHHNSIYNIVYLHVLGSLLLVLYSPASACALYQN